MRACNTTLGLKKKKKNHNQLYTVYLYSAPHWNNVFIYGNTSDISVN